MTDFAWQCLCGNVEYGALEPEECLGCGKIGSFTQLPEELLEEREKESSGFDDLDDGFAEEASLKSVKLDKPRKIKSGKAKTKAKSPRRRK